MSHQTTGPPGRESRSSGDPLGLGSTPGQRRAEMLAGLRAVLAPSPLTEALSRMSGRLMAGTLISIVRDRRYFNFVPVRSGCLTTLAMRALAAGPASPLIVDLAAGFSPRGMELAQNLPHARIIEIDQPDIIEKKRERLFKKGGLTLPANITWLAADLATDPLPKLLRGQQADVIVAEGVAAYYPLAEFTAIAARIRPSLKPGGCFICDVPWQPGMDEIREAGRYFSRFAGNFRGIAQHESEIRAVLEEAGYADVTLHHPAPLAEELGLPTPVFEPSLFLVGRRPR